MTKNVPAALPDPLSIQFGEALINPEKALAELDKLDAEDELKEFLQQGWHTVVPRSRKFVDNWHIDVICEALEAISAREVTRLIINMPPRHMKSLGINVFWPAWEWIHRPETQFLFTTFRHRLTVRDSVACRRLIRSPWYQSNWGEKFGISPDQDTTGFFSNDQHGYRLSASFAGGITGDGGDIIVIDDPHDATAVNSPVKLADTLETYDQAVVSRLNDQKTGAMILTMQRLHENDLTGHILARETGWTHICLPARYEPDHPHHYFADPRRVAGEPLWKKRFDHQGLRNLEIPMGSHVAAGQLQQRPAPRGGGMFRKEWLPIARAVPKMIGSEIRTVRGWDFAATEPRPGLEPDWTVGVKITECDGIYYVEHVERFQATPKGVERKLVNTAFLDTVETEVDFPQDPGQAGKSQVSYLVGKLKGYRVKTSPETGSKTTRAEAFSAQAEAGNVYLIEGDWNEEFINELTVFPGGKHDDQVDAASRAFHRLVAPRATVSTGTF
jgi:predicted phage terminase large subunit-like protein